MTIRSIFIVFVLIAFTGCGKTAPQTQSIKASYDVKVKDPDIKLFTDVTENIRIQASGEFAPGTYFINGAPLTIPPQTYFNLKLSVPINQPGVLHTRDATGTLWTSNQLLVLGIPVPQTIELGQGQVSGEVDFMRSLGAFFLTLLETGTEVSDIKKIIRSMKIDEAILSLRPDSYLHINNNTVHIGPGSTVGLKEVIVGQNLDYAGTFQMNLNFLKGCKFVTEKTEFDFDGGSTAVEMKASRANGQLNFTLHNKLKQIHKISLKHSTFHFGKDRRSSAVSETCLMKLKKMEWQKAANAPHSTFTMTAAMDLEKTRLDFKTDVQETIAVFPEVVPASLQIDIDKSGRSMQFATIQSETAESVNIVIAKKASTLKIWIEDAVIGPASFDKSGALYFGLDSGTAQLKQLEWSSGKHKFKLVTAGGSDLSIPEGMLLEKAGPQSTAHLSLPLQLKLGTASIQGSASEVTLSDLNGSLLIDVGKEVQISGDLDFHLPQSSLLSGYPVDIVAHGLDLSVVEGQTSFQLKKCSVLIPEGALGEAIEQKLPHTWTLNVDKSLSEEQQWRYRNAFAKTVVVTKFDVGKLSHSPPNGVAFTARGDVEVSGTIEQEKSSKSKMSEPESWKTCPWKLTGHLEGDGKVQYHFISKDGPLENQLEYNLSMDLPMPGDIDLDWSQVEGGVLGIVERKVIVHRLRKIALPVKYKGRVAIFPESNSLARHFRVSNLLAKPVTGGTEIAFSATAKF